jgi:hypothetical protein
VIGSTEVSRAAKELDVERENGQSVFRHLNSDEIKIWLDDSGVGDLWEKI